MNIFRLFILFMLVMAMDACKSGHKPDYPVARKVDTVDNYFGTNVPDPYRWLENDTSAETGAWVAAQQQLTESYLSGIPFRNSIRERLTKIWNYPRYGVPFREGPYLFFFKNDGLQNQAVLYVQEGDAGTPRVLLDPNTLSADGTLSLSDLSVSHDGKYMAYSLSQSGSDWNTIHVMEIADGKILGDTLKWVKFSQMAWQGNGFYYSCYDAPKPGMELSSKNEHQKVWYHKVGDRQSADRLIYANPAFPLRTYGVQTTEDERFLILYESESTSGNALWYRDLSGPEVPFRQLTKGFDHEYSVLDHLEGKLLVITNHEAPKRKMVLMDPVAPDPSRWKDIIPEKEEVLETASMAGSGLVAVYMHHASSQAFLYDMTGKQLAEMNLPGIGTLAGFSGKRGVNTAYYGFTSFTFPTTIFRLDLANNTSEVFYRPEIDFNPDLYEVKQIFFASKDGTEVPMFIVMKKGTLLNGENPLLLYGYGGFNVSLTPSFSISRLVFLENGGIYVMVNLRGGGEYGEDWHKAGTREKKQNVFDDFIAAAEYLIREKYTSPEKLAIMGGSNGGLLVGACMTQRPDLFRVAIPQVGVLDMLRYHKFTIGWAWASDYGTSETKEGFDYLIRYSPLHNIREGVNYPATLAFTADHDDRVVPAHTFKFMAELQARHTGPNPVLVRIESKAGHGAGKPTAKIIDEATDLWTFVFYHLGIKP